MGWRWGHGVQEGMVLPTPARHGEGDADHFNCGFWILVSKQGIVSVEVTHFLQGEHNEMIFF